MASAVQGLLLHDASFALYGRATPARVDRGTRPVADRLRDVGQAPLAEPREPADRSVGTCRDFALLAAAFLRVHAISARVRCGFARYLGEAPWADHWVCEYRTDGRWRRLDAQLDEAHRRRLGLWFDPSDVPDDAFMPADRAWRDWRTGRLSAELCGHGTARGPWFLQVNLNRDRLARTDVVTSPWDDWRERPEARRAIASDSNEERRAIGAT